MRRLALICSLLAAGCGAFVPPPPAAGGSDWPGVKFRDVENVLCQSNADGGDGAGNLYARWGDAGEVRVRYNLGSGLITSYWLNAGYLGTLEFKSRPKAQLEPKSWATTGCKGRKPNIIN